MDIIAMARDLGREIQQDPRFKTYHAAKDKADNDPELQDKIGRFNLLKVELQQEIQKPEKSQERMTQIDRELKALYADIMNNDKMTAYNMAKKEMDDLIGFLQQIIVYSANGDDPDTIEQEAAGCSGSCSGCSGCN